MGSLSEALVRSEPRFLDLLLLFLSVPHMTAKSPAYAVFLRFPLHCHVSHIQHQCPSPITDPRQPRAAPSCPGVYGRLHGPRTPRSLSLLSSLPSLLPCQTRTQASLFSIGRTHQDMPCFPSQTTLASQRNARCHVILMCPSAALLCSHQVHVEASAP